MIKFDRFVLDNGLRVLVHQDTSTPMAVVNVMYDVGSRDENPEQTGFAHLFEHLMFGGSIHIPDYDEPLQMAGGENNAYTTNDLTNYYIQLPAENLETAFWLESDRMLSLAFSGKSLDVQRKVVCEEFKEHYINKPYGDVWHKIRELAYSTHAYRWMTIGKELKHVEDAKLQDVKNFFKKHYTPSNAIINKPYGDVWHKIRELAYSTHAYRWMTIGKELKHVEDAKLQDVKNFFKKHYTPSNAILVVAGAVDTAQVKTLTEKWFAGIPAGNKYDRELAPEPPQTAPKTLHIEAAVPLDAFYKTWHMSDRLSDGYYRADLITEIMGSGGSSRLFQKLVKEKQLFSQIECHHMGSIDPGILVIEGKLVKGVTFEAAEAGVNEEVEKLVKLGVEEKELQKAKNKTESMIAFEDMSLMNRANSIAYYELLGDADLMNKELGKYQEVTAAELQEEAIKIFDINNCSTLYYHAINPTGETPLTVTEQLDEIFAS